MNRCSEPLNQKGELMKKEPERFSISVPRELYERLCAMQRNCPGSSRNEMLVSLIRKGLETADRGDFSVKSEEKEEKEGKEE